jgi:hypothetical protein
MTQKEAEADYQARHTERPYHDGTFSDWQPTRSSSHPFHFEWGVTIGVAPVDVNPHDEFRKVEKQSPLPPEASDVSVIDGVQVDSEGHA